MSKKESFEKLEQLTEHVDKKFILQSLFHWFSGTELEEYVEYLQDELGW